MKVHYTGRQIDVTPQVKAQVEDKLNKLHKFLGKHLDLEAHVILSLERHLHTTEITLPLKNQPVVGIASLPDQYSSVKEALEKLETQVLRHKDYTRVTKRRSDAPRTARAEGETPAESNGRPRRAG
jgi:putative sigma-54 modulation protein